jgi:hypothetical protein
MPALFILRDLSRWDESGQCRRQEGRSIGSDGLFMDRDTQECTAHCDAQIGAEIGGW